MPYTRLRHIWTLASGTALAQLITVGASPALSRIYEPYQLGIWALFVAVGSVASVIAAWRLDVAIFLPRSRNVAEALTALCFALICMSSAAAVAALVLATVVLEIWPKTSVPTWLALIPLTILIGGCIQTVVAWRNRNRDYPALRRMRIVQSGVTAFGAITLGIAGFEEDGLIWSTVLGQVSAVAAIAFARGAPTAVFRRRLNILRGLALIRRYRDFPVFSVPEALMGTLTQHLPVILLSALFSLEASGSYSLAYRVTMLPIMVIGVAAGQVFLPDFASMRDITEQRKALRTAWVTSALVALAPALPLLIAGEQIFTYVFGADWALSGQFCEMLAIGLIALFVSSWTSGAHVVLRMQHLSLAFSVSALLIKSGITYVCALRGELLIAILLLAVYDILQVLVINVYAWQRLRVQDGHAGSGARA